MGLGKSSLTQLNKNSPIFYADIIAILRENQEKFTYFSESHYKKEYFAEHPMGKDINRYSKVLRKAKGK